MSIYDEMQQVANQNSGEPTASSDPYSELNKVAQSSPSDLTGATLKQKDPNSQKYNGYCQGFVDDVIGTPQQSRQPSASSAWNNYSQTGQAVQGTQGIQPGDLIYFNDPNDPNGHVGIYSGGDKFISATEVDPKHPVQNQSIGAWQDKTGQTILGYVKNPSSLPAIGGNQNATLQ